MTRWRDPGRFADLGGRSQLCSRLERLRTSGRPLARGHGDYPPAAGYQDNLDRFTRLKFGKTRVPPSRMTVKIDGRGTALALCCKLLGENCQKSDTHQEPE